MIIAIDIGNSRLKWKAWRDDTCVGKGSETDAAAVHAAVTSLASGEATEIWLANVSGSEVESDLLALFAAGSIRHVASSASCLGVINAYQQPEKLGVDRWLAVIEAWHQAGRKAACVIDLGTAATLDVVDDDGKHRGGFIVPGLSLMRESLGRSTRRVRFDLPDQSSGEYGTDTAGAVANGTFMLIAAWLVREVERFRQHYPGAYVCLTGGDAGQFTHLFTAGEVQHEPDLVLNGLWRIALSGQSGVSCCPSL